MTWTAPATVVIGQLMTSAFWNQQVRDNLAAVRDLAFAGTLIAAANSTSALDQPLTTIGTNYTVGGAGVTVNLTAARKLRMVVRATFECASTLGEYSVHVGHNDNAFNLGTAITFGLGDSKTTSIAGSGGDVTACTEEENQFSAGTHVFFPIVRRTAGGSATDFATNGYVAIWDAGPLTP